VSLQRVDLHVLAIVAQATMVFEFSLHGVEDLPIPAGYFVLICNEAEGLPWRTGGNNQQTYGVTIGRIQDVSSVPDRPYMDFYLPTNEYIPPEKNTIDTITSGPCVGITEVVKTCHHGRIDSANILDIAFMLSVDFLEKATPAVALGISNVFICHYQFLDNRVKIIQHHLPSFAPQPQGIIVSRRIDTFPKRAWTWIVLIQQHMRKALSKYGQSQGLYSRSHTTIYFPQDIWIYLSTRFEVQVQHRILMRSRKSYHRLTDRLAVEAMRLTTPSEQYMFEREKDLDCFRSVFGTTSTFGVRCRGPKVGNPPRTLQHNDMINAVLPLGRNEQAASGIKLSFNQQVELKISVYYEAYNYTANAAGCPCPVLLSTIKGAGRIVLQNESILQCKVVFNDPRNGFIMEIIKVTEDSVSATILSPRDCHGQILTYHDKVFVIERAKAFNDL